MDLQDKTCVADGSIEKYKEIFVAIGFSQKEGIDYEDTFSLVARYTSIKTIMALSSMMKWDLHQMHVKKAFLNGVLRKRFTSRSHKDLKLKIEQLMYAS